MAFTPKFVDLVKDFTTVQGTGPVSLDMPVTGFTSFASACAPGDQFYYCIQGVDRPAEREVGRGTMLTDGTIGRDPIGGGATNFTKGKKSIALVAAAEWLGQVDAAIKTQGPAARDPLFNALAGSAIPAQQTLVETAGYAEAGAGCGRYVVSDSVDAAHVAANPRTSFLAADGRGFKLDPQQRLTGEMFGMVPNDASKAAANRDALLAALNWRPVAGKNFGPEIHLGIGDYHIDGLIEPNNRFTLIGQDSGEVRHDAQGAVTRIIQHANTTTLRIRYKSDGAGGNAANEAYTSAATSVVRGISIHYQTFTTDLDKHAIDIRAQATIERCTFYQVPGDGIHIEGFTDGGGRYGDANDWRVVDCAVHSARGSGLFINGSDVNAGVSRNFHTHHDVEGCGIRDQSYYGNTHINPQLTGYGNRGVHRAGQHYQLIYHDPAVAAATEPGTNTGIWFPLAAGGVSGAFPEWNAADASQHRLKLPYWLLTPLSQIVGGYQELGAVGSHGGTRFGGLHSVTHTSAQFGAGTDGSMSNTTGIGQMIRTGGDVGNALYPWIGEGEGTFIGRKGMSAASKFRKAYLLTHEMKGAVLYWGYGLNGEGSSVDIDLGFFNSDPIQRITMPGTAATFGRSTSQPGIMVFHRFAIGDTDAAWALGSNGRVLRGGVAAPTAGEHAQGEFTFNIGSPSGGIFGWSCVETGTPGKHYPLTLFSPVSSIAATTYGFVFADGGGYRRFTAATAVVATVPTDAAEPLPIGTMIELEQGGGGVVTVAAADGVTVNSRGGKVATAGQFAVAMLKKVAANTWTLTGDLA